MTMPSRRFMSASVGTHHHHLPPAPKGVSSATKLRAGGKWVLPVAALVVGGAALAPSLQKQLSSARGADPEQQKVQNATLMDSYGDRGSLEDIQKAVEAYESSSR